MTKSGTQFISFTTAYLDPILDSPAELVFNVVIADQTEQTNLCQIESLKSLLRTNSFRNQTDSVRCALSSGPNPVNGAVILCVAIMSHVDDHTKLQLRYVDGITAANAHERKRMHAAMQNECGVMAVLSSLFIIML